MTLDLSKLKLIDLTHTLTSEIASWEGGCGFKSINKIDYEDCETPVKFRVQELRMRAGMGTHIDAPAHCIKGGACIDDLALSQLIVPCIKIDVSDQADENFILTMDHIREFEAQHGSVAKGSVVIVYTGWDKFWGDRKRYRNELKFPSVSHLVAEYLVQKEVVGMGIDTLSPDRSDSGFPVHKIMLGQGKYIIENVANADKLPATGSIVLVLPLKVKQGTEAPLRLVALL